MSTIDPSLSHDAALRRLQALQDHVDRFWEAFWHRPGMLGMPHDVEAMFHHIDWIEHQTESASSTAGASSSAIPGSPSNVKSSRSHGCSPTATICLRAPGSS